MGFFSDLWDDIFGKKDTPAEWARKLSDEELRSFYIAGPGWHDPPEFDAVMDEMDWRQMDMPHLPGGW